MRKYNVLDYGIKPDGETLNTEKLQNLLDELPNGRQIVCFPRGKYVLSTVFLKSNVRIELEEGAEILGSKNFADFAEQERVDFEIYQDPSHTYFHPSLFVAENCENVEICGGGKIDMRSVWDEENKNGCANRGAKCISLKSCKNVKIDGIEIDNVTDLAVYFADCENVTVTNLKLKVYIDGISPDNSKNVYINNCEVESGDDGIVFKSSYNLNRLGKCENIKVENCKVKSRCNAIKFGTETNGGFENFEIKNIEIVDTRIAGIAIESVDGAILNNIHLRDIKMQNVNAPIFIHIGKRMRGPVGRSYGKIQNITLENITAKGPYVPYKIIAWNYKSYKANDFYQYPWIFGSAEGVDSLEENEDSNWQMTSNICGIEESKLENITLRNCRFELKGGVEQYERNVPEKAGIYPEVYVYGKILPAKAIYFRHIDNLILDNVTVKTERPDKRPDFEFDDVTAKKN